MLDPVSYPISLKPPLLVKHQHRSLDRAFDLLRMPFNRSKDLALQYACSILKPYPLENRKACDLSFPREKLLNSKIKSRWIILGSL